jgi:hypothetical protein
MTIGSTGQTRSWLAGGEAIADDIELSLPVEAKDVGLSVVLVGCNMMARDFEGKFAERGKAGSG